MQSTARSRRQIPAQLAFRGCVFFFYDWTCPWSNPVFCLLICSCRVWGIPRPLWVLETFPCVHSTMSEPLGVGTMACSVPW